MWLLVDTSRQFYRDLCFLSFCNPLIFDRLSFTKEMCVLLMQNECHRGDSQPDSCLYSYRPLGQDRGLKLQIEYSLRLLVPTHRSNHLRISRTSVCNKHSILGATQRNCLFSFTAFLSSSSVTEINTNVTLKKVSEDYAQGFLPENIKYLFPIQS
jgi:hypothetical protein